MIVASGSALCFDMILSRNSLSNVAGFHISSARGESAALAHIGQRRSGGASPQCTIATGVARGIPMLCTSAVIYDLLSAKSCWHVTGIRHMP